VRIVGEVFEVIGMTPRRTPGDGGVLGHRDRPRGGIIATPAGVALHQYVVPVMGHAAQTNLPAALLSVYPPSEPALLALSGRLIAAAGALGPASWVARTRTATALQRLLGYTSFGAIIFWVPLFMFVLLFGLSMDYHVFILSRVRELRSRGASTAEALVGGISSSAGVVTSAAVIMVAVFSILATLPIVDTKTLGVGLAAAVLIDATVVRGILLPAAMSLLGERCWYLPRWLSWLPGRRLPARSPVPGETVGGEVSPESVRVG
jgi:uncharacterized membrane protein YdfJ with MMPL/SSD domain